MNKIIKTVKVGKHVLEVMKTAILSRGSIEPIRDWWNGAVEHAYSVVEFGDDAFLPEQWIEG